MDYTDFVGRNVRITTLDGEVCDTFIWGLRFEDETEQVVREVWTEKYTFKVEHILKIEALVENE